MSQFRPRGLNFDLAVRMGLVEGVTTVVVRGHNSAIAAAAGFVDIAEFGNLTYLTSAETMNIVSTSTSDTVAGVGLRNILLEGVDSTGAYIFEVVNLNGTSDVESANSYLRVNTMTGATAGTTGWNVGDITATASSAATIQCEMDATEGISQNSQYTVPLNKTLHVVQLELNASQGGAGQSPEIEFKAYARLGGAGFAWLQSYDKKMDVSLTNELDVTGPFAATPATARTDFKMMADTDQDSTEVRTRLYGYLIDDE